MYFLKYRPQTIDDLDLKDVRKELKKILSQDSIPQAFLFAGPKGTGKTSAARILAKAVNCSQSDSFQPCNQCQVCKEITRGTSLDVIEIDAASNTGIDDVRSLKEKIGLAPIKAKYKVYIMDEVHMLSTKAFNALLKTLEEPPSHVIFVLCTTDPDKIIPTVMSRLIRIDFHRATPDELKRSLKKVIQGENLTVDKAVIENIIQISDGGFRDAQKILENLVLNLGKEINLEEAEEFLGQWRKRKPETVISLIANQKMDEVVEIGEKLVEEGADFDSYLQKLLTLVQKLIFVKVGAEKRQDLNQLAEKFKVNDLVELSDLFSEAAYRQKNALLPQLPFQLAVVKYLGKRQEKREGNGSLQTGQKKKKKKFENKITKKNAEISLNQVKKKWNQLLKAVKPMNHSVAAFLKAAQPKGLKGDYLVLEVSYQFHKDKLEEHRNRQIVEQGMEKVFDSCVKIKCILADQKDDLYSTAKNIFG